MYEEIQQKYPQEFALRDQDKYRYRYPKGEVSKKETWFVNVKEELQNGKYLEVCLSSPGLASGQMKLTDPFGCFLEH